MNENKEKLNRALESDEAFLSFLIQGTRTEGYRKLRHRAEPEDHPSTEMLGEYVSDQLDEEKTESVMRHLAVCKLCNDEVLMLRSVENESETEEDIAGLVNRPPDCIERLKKSASDIASAYHELISRAWFRPLVSGLSMAAVCAVIYMRIISPPDAGELLAGAYQTAIGQNLTGGQSFGFPWKKDQVYGLTSSSRSNPLYRAFAAGLWAGSQELKQQTAESMPDILSPEHHGEKTAKKWTETRWAAYYRAGQWSFLLRIVSLSDTEIPESFWEKQKDILGRLMADFAAVPERHEEEIRIVNARFDSLQSLLENPGSISPGKRQKIASETELLINYLSSE